MSEATPFQGMPPDQQLAYVRDVRRIYAAERARRRELEEKNRALAAANRALEQRVYDLLAVQDWLLAINSNRELPTLIDLLAQPLVLLLGAQAVLVFPWDRASERLQGVLGFGLPTETPALAALRTSTLSRAILATDTPWTAGDLDVADGQTGVDHGPARALGWRALVGAPLRARGLTVGLLYTGWSEPRQWDERERLLLTILAQHVAVAVANAPLRTEGTR